MRRTVSRSLTISWSVHDSWSESFIGTRHLIYNVIPPDDGHHRAVENGALCQLGLIGANHLMEISLYKVLSTLIESPGDQLPLIKSLLDDANYYQMLTRWLPAATGTSIKIGEEPFLSTESLRRRRNATAHKTSAVATIQMVRSALYSSLQGCRAIYQSAGIDFPYEQFITKYPIEEEPWFSTLKLP